MRSGVRSPSAPPILIKHLEQQSSLLFGCGQIVAKESGLHSEIKSWRLDSALMEITLPLPGSVDGRSPSFQSSVLSLLTLGCQIIHGHKLTLGDSHGSLQSVQNQ